jgi:hypothetical protein
MKQMPHLKNLMYHEITSSSVIMSVYQNICLTGLAHHKHVRLTFGKYLVWILARVVYPDQNLPQSIQNNAYVHQNKPLYLTSLSIHHEHPSFCISFGATLAVNTFATSLSVGNLNTQPKVFKCQGTFMHSLTSKILQNLFAYIAVWPKSGTVIYMWEHFSRNCLDVGADVLI